MSSVKETNKEALRRQNKINFLRHKLNTGTFFAIFLLIVSATILYFGFYKQSSYSINKIEKGTTNYKVYVNKDDIYKNDYQESGYSYISSTIDYIKTHYNYELKYNKKVETKYDYEIKSILTIKEPGVDGKVLYKEEFQELDKKKDFDLVRDVNINENLKIDYKKYNKAVENYKRNYGVSVDANVKTVMYITLKTTLDDQEVFNTVRELSTTVPLGEHTLSITTNNPIDYVEELNGKKELKINVVLLIIGIASTLYAIVYIIRLLVIYNKYKELRTIYDMKLEKILKEYDRVIVVTDATKIKQEFKNIISVNEFQELVDVRDNTEQPILYIEREIGRHADFMVINNDTVYVYDFDIDKISK